VIFFDEQKTVLVEPYQDKAKAEKRMNDYIGGYQVRIEQLGDSV